MTSANIVQITGSFDHMNISVTETLFLIIKAITQFFRKWQVFPDIADIFGDLWHVSIPINPLSMRGWPKSDEIIGIKNFL